MIFTFDSNMLSQNLKQKALFLTKKETYQAVEGLYHNLNTLQSRSGNQLPLVLLILVLVPALKVE